MSFVLEPIALRAVSRYGAINTATSRHRDRVSRGRHSRDRVRGGRTATAGIAPPTAFDVAPNNS